MKRQAEFVNDDILEELLGREKEPRSLLWSIARIRATRNIDESSFRLTIVDNPIRWFVINEARTAIHCSVPGCGSVLLC